MQVHSPWRFIASRSIYVKHRSEFPSTLPDTHPGHLHTLLSVTLRGAGGRDLLIPVSDLKNAKKVTNDLRLPHRQETDVKLQPRAVLFCALNRLTSSNGMIIQNSRSEGRE